MDDKIKTYLNQLNKIEKEICELLIILIDNELLDSESKVWHAHPVWFLNGNPIVGFSKQKRGVRLMFWSGLDFEEESLNVIGSKFKDASIFYNHVSEIEIESVKRCLNKSIEIQWDYKNLIKRKGVLEKLYLNKC